jgi:hypothetical protein
VLGLSLGVYLMMLKLDGDLNSTKDILDTPRNLRANSISWEEDYFLFVCGNPASIDCEFAKPEHS